MTLAELREQVWVYLDDLQGGYFTEAQVNRWINNAQWELQKKLIDAGQNYYLECVQTNTVINQSDYVLPLDFKKLHRLELVVSGTVPNESVQAIMPVTLNQQDLIPNGVGQPFYYYIKRNRIVLLPTPQQVQVLRLYYSYQATEMVNDTDEPDAPETYQEWIALLAAQDGFLRDGRSSDILSAKLAAYEKRLEEDANERQQDVPRQVVETGIYDGGFFW